MIYNLDENSVNKIIDIFKDTFLFINFHYFDLKVPEEKEYAEKFLKEKLMHNNIFFFFERINEYDFPNIILINNLNTIYSLQESTTQNKDVKKFFGLYFCTNSDIINHKEKICIYGLAKENLKLQSEAYQYLGKLEDKIFFILSFLFCMLNKGTKKNEDTESFTLDFFKKEIERIEEILKELINNRKIEELEKAIKDANNKTSKNIMTINNKEAFKKILEPFFQKNIKKEIEKKEDFIEKEIQEISNKNNEDPKEEEENPKKEEKQENPKKENPKKEKENHQKEEDSPSSDLKTQKEKEVKKIPEKKQSNLKFCLGILFFLIILIFLIIFYKKYF